jgi:DNA-binding MarR family transcriptional regulator
MPPEAASAVDEVPLTALLRAARNTYGSTIRRAIVAAGFDDVPRNGIYVISAISRTEAPLGTIIEWLGVSKQAGGQVVDTLVARGYLDRRVDDEDRRRLKVTLTERGRALARVTRATVERVDEKLRRAVGARHVEHTRATLLALITLSS